MLLVVSRSKGCPEVWEDVIRLESCEIALDTIRHRVAIQANGDTEAAAYRPHVSWSGGYPSGRT